MWIVWLGVGSVLGAALCAVYTLWTYQLTKRK